jgi:thiol-disulfide isomerase/thioredoxin
MNHKWKCLCIIVLVGVLVYLILLSNNVIQSPVPNTPANTLEGFQDNGCPEVTQESDLQPNNEQIIIAMFYAEWCGYCKQLKPKFNEICKNRLSTINSQRSDGTVVLKLVDCVAHEDLREKYNINAFPTLKIFKKSNAEQHPLGQTYTGNTQEVDVLTNNLIRLSL